MGITTELSIRRLPGDTEEQAPVSEILLHGESTGQLVSGAILEAAIRCQPGYLLFMTDDVPFEEVLGIVLLDTHCHVLDEARLGGPYTTGSFSDLQWREPDIACFRFIGNIDWSVRVLPRPQWRVPLFSGPPGVWRSWGFFRHFLVQGHPQPQT